MIYKIITNDIDKVSLLDILNNIEGKDLEWSIFSLWAINNPKNQESILDLENRISKSEKGVTLSFDELKKIAYSLKEIMDIYIVGCVNNNCVLKQYKEEEILEKCNFIIEMDDSTSWIIHVQDKDIKKIINFFNTLPSSFNLTRSTCPKVE